jgi:hypothetical protein
MANKTSTKTGKTGKRSNFGGSKKTGPPPKKGGVPPKRGWEWAPFTKKSVVFNTEARELSALLTQTYGDTVSITLFEKMISSYPSMTAEQKPLIHMNDQLIAKFKRYKTARDERDTERDSFRGDIAVANVEGGLEALSEAMHN